MVSEISNLARARRARRQVGIIRMRRASVTLVNFISLHTTTAHLKLHIYIVYYIYIIRTKVSVPDIRYRSTYIKAKRPIFPAFLASTSLSYCNPQTCRNKQKMPSPLPVCTGGMRGQCHTCSSHSYNPNLPSGPSGPRQIGNYTS